MRALYSTQIRLKATVVAVDTFEAKQRPLVGSIFNRESYPNIPKIQLTSISTSCPAPTRAESCRMLTHGRHYGPFLIIYFFMLRALLP